MRLSQKRAPCKRTDKLSSPQIIPLSDYFRNSFVWLQSRLDLLRWSQFFIDLIRFDYKSMRIWMRSIDGGGVHLVTHTNLARGWELGGGSLVVAGGWIIVRS